MNHSAQLKIKRSINVACCIVAYPELCIQRNSTCRIFVCSLSCKLVLLKIILVLYACYAAHNRCILRIKQRIILCIIIFYFTQIFIRKSGDKVAVNSQTDFLKAITSTYSQGILCCLFFKLVNIIVIIRTVASRNTSFR